MEKRKSIIRKKIGRKIQTKQYESLEVYVDIEEEIEWTDGKERAKKTKAINKVLIDDYKETMKQVLEELKLHQNKANVKVQGDVPSDELADKIKDEADSIF